MKSELLWERQRSLLSLFLFSNTVIAKIKGENGIKFGGKIGLLIPGILIGEGISWLSFSTSTEMIRVTIRNCGHKKE